jgi:hypothetical protein
MQMFSDISSRLRPDDVRPLLPSCVRFFSGKSSQIFRFNDGDEASAANACASLIATLPKPEQLTTLASALKLPLVYGKSKRKLIEAIMQQRDEKTALEDDWSVIIWMRRTGVDVTSSPKQT